MKMHKQNDYDQEALAYYAAFPALAKNMGAMFRYSRTSEDEVKERLQGAIMLCEMENHEFTQPAWLDFQMLTAAKRLGMRAVMLVNHFAPTAAVAKVMQERSKWLRVFGSLVLNQATGGLNPSLVEKELASGAKRISMPTYNAENDRVLNGDKGQQAVLLTNDKGTALPELYDILDLIAKYDAVLDAGYLEAEDTENLVALAKARGVNKIVVPMTDGGKAGFSLAVQKRLVEDGALLERKLFHRMRRLMVGDYLQMVGEIRETGIEGNMILLPSSSYAGGLATDLYYGMKILLEFGLTLDEIERLFKQNPCALLEG